MVEGQRDTKDLEEWRKRVVEAKVRLVLGLGPQEDVSKLWRKVTVEEQQQEVRSLEEEVGRLKTGLAVGEGGKADLERELKEVNHEYEDVRQGMERMWREQRERERLTGDCDTLRIMIDNVGRHIEWVGRKLGVVREDLTKAGTREVQLKEQLEEAEKKQDKVKRAEVLASFAALKGGNQQ